MQGVATEQTPLAAHFKSGLSFLCVDGVLIFVHVSSVRKWECSGDKSQMTWHHHGNSRPLPRDWLRSRHMTLFKSVRRETVRALKGNSPLALKRGTRRRQSLIIDMPGTADEAKPTQEVRTTVKWSHSPASPGAFPTYGQLAQ